MPPAHRYRKHMVPVVGYPVGRAGGGVVFRGFRIYGNGLKAELRAFLT